VTAFYEFLWEAVRRPTLIIDYAREIGVSLPQPPEEFHQRLEYVADAVVRILEAERGDDAFWKKRCLEAKRFYLETSQDLREVGIVMKEFRLC
jgi:hypothetical protein